MGRASIKLLIVLLCVTAALQLFVLLIGAFHNPSLTNVDPPPSVSLWIKQAGSTLNPWTWRRPNEPALMRRNSIILLCFVCGSLLFSILTFIALIFGLLAKSQYAFAKQRRWSVLLPVCALVSFLISVVPAILTCTLFFKDRVTLSELGISFILWCVACLLGLVSLLPSVFALRRSGAVLKTTVIFE